MTTAAILVLAILYVTFPATTSEELEPDSCYMQAVCPNKGIQKTLKDIEDRLASLETLTTRLVNGLLDKTNDCLETTPRPRPSDAPVTSTTCVRGMAKPGLETRIPVKVLGSREALCDTQTDGGGWIIIQRRMKGDVDFYRGWEDYKRGFGDITTDYWLGLDAIHQLLSDGQYELRVDMTARGRNYYAYYSTFKVGGEDSNYKLTVGGFRGNTKDGLDRQNNMPFTTLDRDNDKYRLNCAVEHHGAWWYQACNNSNLNGQWAGNGQQGMVWWGVVDSGSVDSSEMKIRRI